MTIDHHTAAKLSKAGTLAENQDVGPRLRPLYLYTKGELEDMVSDPEYRAKDVAPIPLLSLPISSPVNIASWRRPK
jgi:hypothetical protein